VQFKVIQLIGSILEEISNRFTFMQIFVFLLCLGMAIAVFVPIIVSSI